MNFLKTEIDTSNMTMEELKEPHDELQEIIDGLDYQIINRKNYENIHSSTTPFYS